MNNPTDYYEQNKINPQTLSQYTEKTILQYLKVKLKFDEYQFDVYNNIYTNVRLESLFIFWFTFTNFLEFSPYTEVRCRSMGQW